MLNSPKLIEEEKAKMATKEKALKKKEGKKTLGKAHHTINGTGGTTIHVSTLHVSIIKHYLSKFPNSTICMKLHTCILLVNSFTFLQYFK